MSVLTKGFAEARGGEMALVDDDGMRTWSELDLRINQLIHSMRAAGLAAGDTISIVSGNRNEWFEIAMACANAGITFVPVNWHLVGPEIAYILDDSDSKAVFVDHRFVDEVARALDDERTSRVQLAVGGRRARQRPFPELRDIHRDVVDRRTRRPVVRRPDVLHVGHHRQPKGVRGSLSGMETGTTPEIWHLIGAGFGAMMTVPGITVLCGPAYHSAQWAFSFMPMMAGSSTVMQHKYDSAKVLELIDTYQAPTSTWCPRR